MLGDIIIANIIASGFLLVLIYFLDLNEKEPPWILVRLYILSILVTFLFGKLKIYLFSRYEWTFSNLINNYIVAGFFEEIVKFGIVMVFVWPLRSFNEVTDGIIYYLIVAAGFAVIENLGYAYQFVINPYLYAMQTGELAFYKSALQRIVLLRAVSGHIFINIVSGYFLGLAKMRSKAWLLIPGFLVSVLLHGTWNQSIVMGWIGVFAIVFFALDAALFVITLRSSFYYKFMKRLKNRIRTLIREGRNANLDADIIALMEGISGNVRSLRQLQGSVLKVQAKEITQLLPPRIDAVPVSGENGLVERMLKVNGILSRDRKRTGFRFWIGFFFRFAIPGFAVLLLLMELR